MAPPRATMRSTTAVTSWSLSPTTMPYLPSLKRARRISSTAERARHDLLAPQVLVRARNLHAFEQLARHRGLEAVRRVPGHVPAARATGEVAPVLGGVGHVGRLVDLLHLGGVLGDEAVRLDEVGEDVVAG